MELELARALASITTGIYVLTVADGERHHGMSSSWVTLVSGVPALLIAAVDTSHFSHPIIERTRVFGLNVIGRRGKSLEDYFYSANSRRPDNLREIDYELSPALKVPWLKLAMVSIEARAIEKFSAGDHTLWVAQPAGSRLSERDTPLTSHDLDYVYLGGKQLFARARLRGD